MRKRIQQICLAAIVGIAICEWIGPSQAFSKDDFRSWGDAKGKNKVTAKFVKLEGDIVTLEKDDGEEVEIELKKLSAADQKFVADAVKEADNSPFKKKSSDPFKPKPKTDKKSPGAAEKEEEPREFKSITVKMTSSKPLKLVAPGKSWKVEVPDNEPQSALDEDQTVSLPAKSDFFDKLNGMAVSRGETRKSVVSYTLEKPGSGKPTSCIALCDLGTGESERTESVPGPYMVVALHDDAHQVLMVRNEWGFGKSDHLEVWKVNGDNASRAFGWIPYDFEQGAARDVKWAQFVDSERLLTCNSVGRIILWKYPEIRPICGIETCQGCTPALSPDRKLLAYSTGSAVGVLDITRQKVVAQQAAPSNLTSPQFAFSPTMKRMACASHDKILIWDLASGKLNQTISSDGVSIGGHLDFVDDNFILSGNSTLIDIESGIKLWTYHGADQLQVVGGSVLIALAGGGGAQEGALLATHLPHPAASKFLEKALTDPSDFIVHPGTTVRIDVSGIPDALQREKVINGLAKQLNEIQCTVDPKGTIDIVASVEGPKTIDVSYSKSGDYKFKEFKTFVKFVQGKQTVWESSGTNAPGIFSLKQGETVESHLRTCEKPNYEFFDRVSLPRFLSKPAQGQGASRSLTLGTSQFSANGIR